MPDFNPNWLSPVSSYFSIAGFGLTIWTLVSTFKVRQELSKIEKMYSLRLHAPRLINRITEHRKIISECLDNFDGSINRAEEETKKVVVTARSLNEMTEGADAEYVSKLLEIANLFTSSKSTQEQLREIYLLLIQVDEQVQESQEVKYGSNGTFSRQESGRSRTPVA